MSKSIVSIVKGSDPVAMVEEALEHLGGVKSLIKRKSTVVLKPNAGHLGPPETSVNTSPGLVAAAIKVIRKAEPKEIILAEASAMGCDTSECLESSGIRKAAQDAGIDKIIDIKTHTDLINIPIRDATSDLKKISLPRFLIEADHIVNLPIFKSHVSMVFTCALKNIKGVVQDKVHYLMHQTNLADAMMDLWSVVKADLIIADLIRPMEGFGPHSGVPRQFDCVVAGKDPVAVDATVCRMVGLDIEKVDYFRAATNRGIGHPEADKIEIRGNTIEEVHKPLYMPYLDGFDSWPEYNFHIEHACSSCLGLVAFNMTKLKYLDQYENNKGMDIVVGRKKNLPEGVKPGKNLILFGDCTRPLRKKIGNDCIFVAGCPPMESMSTRAFLDREDQIERQPGARERHNAETKIFMKRLKEEMEKRSS
ncbi:MAG: DUF362 domain-containing protein [Pseudomonadota bacterium]